MPDVLNSYKETLAKLDAAYPGKEVLSKAEVAAFLGISAKTLKKKYELPPGMCSKVQVAKALCRN